MVDVIFGGTDDRRPMGFAEVSVTFDNRDPVNRLDVDFDEVTITRRYYRTGESEYYLNQKQVRLKDVVDLFLNTGENNYIRIHRHTNRQNNTCHTLNTVCRNVYNSFNKTGRCY